MILFFNWNNLVKLSKGDPIKTVSLLNLYYRDGLMKPGAKMSLKGRSFILNPSGLFKDTSTDILHIYQYLYLVSRRDYTLYKLYGIKYLPLDHFTDIDLNIIKSNPLLKINNSNLYFKYEEINGTSI